MTSAGMARVPSPLHLLRPPPTSPCFRRTIPPTEYLARLRPASNDSSSSSEVKIDAIFVFVGGEDRGGVRLDGRCCFEEGFLDGVWQEGAIFGEGFLGVVLVGVQTEEEEKFWVGRNEEEVGRNKTKKLNYYFIIKLIIF